MEEDQMKTPIAITSVASGMYTIVHVLYSDGSVLVQEGSSNGWTRAKGSDPVVMEANHE